MTSNCTSTRSGPSSPSPLGKSSNMTSSSSSSSSTSPSSSSSSSPPPPSSFRGNTHRDTRPRRSSPLSSRSASTVDFGVDGSHATGNDAEEEEDEDEQGREGERMQVESGKARDGYGEGRSDSHPVEHTSPIRGRRPCSPPYPSTSTLTTNEPDRTTTSIPSPTPPSPNFPRSARLLPLAISLSTASNPSPLPTTTTTTTITSTPHEKPPIRTGSRPLHQTPQPTRLSGFTSLSSLASGGFPSLNKYSSNGTSGGKRPGPGQTQGRTKIIVPTRGFKGCFELGLTQAELARSD